LAPLALMPGMGAFLFRPMALAVAFAMIVAYGLSRTYVPAICSLWLRGHASPTTAHSPDMHSVAEHHDRTLPKAELGGRFARWEAVIESGIRGYIALLSRAMKMRTVVVLSAVALLAIVLVGIGSQLRREFFPEVDAGSFEIYVRAKSGTRIEETEKRI